MQTFLEKFAGHFLGLEIDLSRVIIVLPARRASVFLKRELSLIIDRPIFAPAITTIDDLFMETLGWQQENNPTLLFKLFEAYQKLDLEVKDNFAEFSKWAQILLGDLNEVDRYQVDPNQLFSYLADVKRIQSWNLTPGESADTHMLDEYLKLWHALPALYRNYTDSLKKDKKVYQGLAYREIAENISSYIPGLKDKYDQLFFVGFSALNIAEEKVLMELHREGLASFYWDIDTYYFDDPLHEAGKFLRNSPLVKKLREQGKFYWPDSAMTRQAKKIRVISASGNTSQMVAANSRVLSYMDSAPEDVAVVLADEGLLQTFLNNLGEPVKDINVTMGLPLRNTPIAGFFSLIWEMLIWQEANKRSDSEGNPAFHHQKWDDLLGHPFFARMTKEVEEIEKTRVRIRKQNLIYISFSQLRTWGDLFPDELSAIFTAKDYEPADFCREFARLCEWVKGRYDENDYQADLLFSFYKLFMQLKALFEEYDFVKDLKTTRQFYYDLLQSETVDLRGEPLRGLQVMGMLETRTLDFKNLIITSVNEDVLPKGRSQNSLIPFDIKLEFGLPTYLEKDAVFAYHFYRLLQRAENITLIYNNRNKGLGGGEPSRFIAQLEYELAENNPSVEFSNEVWSGNLRSAEIGDSEVRKTPAIMKRLQEMAEKGISPTAIIDYINNPLEFYYKRVLGLREADEVEEVIGYDTQGTVIHEILEDYYSIDENRKNGPIKELHQALPSFLRSEEELRQEVVNRLHERGLKYLDQGKNLLVRETLTGMLRNFLEREEEELKDTLGKGEKIKIISLEKVMHHTINLSDERKVKIIGIADRVQKTGDEITVVDYKTGGVNSRDLAIKDIQELRQPEKKNKSLQLMTYAYLYLNNEPDQLQVRAAILSLRNVKEWLMPLKYGSVEHISREITAEFEVFLKDVLEEIFDPVISFKEKMLTLDTDD